MPVNANKVIRREVDASDAICDKASRKAKNIQNDIINGSIALCRALYKVKKAYRHLQPHELQAYSEYAKRDFVRD